MSFHLPPVALTVKSNPCSPVLINSTLTRKVFMAMNYYSNKCWYKTTQADFFPGDAGGKTEASERESLLETLLPATCIYIQHVHQGMGACSLSSINTTAVLASRRQRYNKANTRRSLLSNEQLRSFKKNEAQTGSFSLTTSALCRIWMNSSLFPVFRGQSY